MKNRIRFALGLGAGLATLTFAAVIRASDADTPLPEYWAAPDFELIDQEGAPLAADDLRGSVWVASFVFTSCADVCPAITARMARLADDFRREGVLGEGVRLVSFTVDPERDTPDVLLDYAAGFGGLPASDWAFVTGVSGDSLRALIQGGFRLTAMLPAAADAAHPTGDAAEAHEAHEAAHEAPADYQVAHSPRVLLVDQRGTVRGIHDATDAASMQALIGDALALLER